LLWSSTMYSQKIIRETTDGVLKYSMEVTNESPDGTTTYRSSPVDSLSMVSDLFKHTIALYETLTLKRTELEELEKSANQARLLYAKYDTSGYNVRAAINYAPDLLGTYTWKNDTFNIASGKAGRLILTTKGKQSGNVVVWSYSSLEIRNYFILNNTKINVLLTRGIKEWYFTIDKTKHRLRKI